MITIQETSEWIAVDSAFGGLAIYRRSLLDAARYRGKDENNEIVCEHVWLHRQLKANGARLFINPRMINTADTPQSYERSFLQSIYRFILDLRHEIKIAAMRVFSQTQL